MIVEGEVPAGQTLPPERELARQFSVSSTVVREALQTLSAIGLLDIRHGVGSFVTTPDHWHAAEPIAALIRSKRATLLHVLEVRVGIEVEAAGLATERGDPNLLQVLDGMLDAMERTVHDPIANVEADMEFHRLLAAGSGNPVLPIVLQPILAPIHTGMLRGTRLPAAMSRALAEHRNIRDAVAARDPSAAREAMRAHLSTARSEIEAYGRDDAR